MKKIFLGILSLVALAGVISSCQKLNVAVTSEITPDSYPKTDAQFTSAEGPVFVALRADYATSYWFLQSCSSDEAVLATFGPNWIDGNKYVELHRHTWTKDNAWVNSAWTYLANIIGTANQTISVIRASAPAGPAKSTSLAELKTVRALAYYYMLDSYGNVPLDTLYGVTTPNPTSSRSQVFNFVESELKLAIPYLKNPSTATYGLPTKYLAYAILAKMYLNAQVYTGTSRNDDCIAACDQIISSGNYSLEPMSTYLQQFYPTNGPSQKEFIFAIPYDASTTSGNMFFARYDLNRNLGIRYSYSGSTAGAYTDPVMNKDKGNGLANNQPSGPRMTTAEYYANFDDPNDIRNKQWLSGQQYWQDGTPIMVSTTNIGYNQFYSGGSPSAAYVYSLVITPLSSTSVRPGTGGSFDLGNDEIAWNTGIRNIKFLADYTNTISRNQNNDVPLFRYSDIILMKAEAILRGGTATLGATALSLVNQIKAVRTTTAALTSVTLTDIYKERCKELAWENWHRNDMIRFGQFENSYGIGKTDADVNHRLFPIPTTALATNSRLTQNPGY
ncbi:carbohydrate-binding protein SusD [Mucilaginibacter sp. PPCGB 2223]|uniref:RagB/SusD family nutrient uptake outer membrane protein n=1 Tax=Mucilaginibacter sp. PPCGB 2223 TaxID=1886027 RepID=UPI0008244C33|nr:RagB/SusD family nutrient uptake outer membrane protein [Mucilaginibacter sp. PPCGB 2223]OCX52280.1 carbohydrate-binding protein SusD [Mucilaginibacter sp. PPCGB 2223]